MITYSRFFLRAWFLTVAIFFVAAGSVLEAQTNLTWGPNGSGLPVGGSGTWNVTTPNWTLDNGVTYQTWPTSSEPGDGYAIFGGTAGTVTITDALTANGLRFDTDGYIVSSSGLGSLTMVNNTNGFAPHITVSNAGDSATINATITPSTNYESLLIDGAGTLNLAGSTTLSGDININGATLRLQTATGSLNAANLVLGSGAGGTFILDNTGATGATDQHFGSLELFGGDTTIQSNRVAAQNVALIFDNSVYFYAPGATTNFVVNGGVNGTENLINLAAYSEGFISPSGFFNGSNYAWQDSGGFLRGINYGVDAGSVTSAGGVSIPSTAFVQTTGAITAQTDATFTTLNISGANDFTVADGNTLTVSGILKSGTGAANINGGTILPGSQELVVRTDLASDSLTINSVITDNSGSILTKSGQGILTLTGNNTFTGSLFINGGKVSVATLPTATEASPIGEGTLVFSGGTLQYTGSGSVTTTHPFYVTGGGTFEVTDVGATVNLNSGIGGPNTQLYSDSFVKTGLGTLIL
ncbi:MAG: autotransporter-associated beta strand repeat-containing protein, partial [Chthoniobacterales bacterium]